MEILKNEYYLEVYEESFINNSSISWFSESAFPTLNVGDYFEHRCYDRWYNTPQQGERFKVKEIEHMFWEIGNSHLGHKLMVCLETVVSSKP